MYYEIHGEGEPILLIHGWGGTHEFWGAQVTELSKSFKVITCDLRGHGESDKADPREYSIKLFANDLRMLLDKLGVEKLHVVGHSLGGVLAEQLVVESPERFETLVICDSPSRRAFSKLTMLLLRFVSRPSKKWLRRSRGLYYSQPTEENLNRLISWYSKAGKPVIYNTARTLLDYTTPKELTSISIPTLIAYGEKSLFLKHGVEIHKMLLGSKFVVVSNASHMMPIEQPEEFNKLVSDFCGTRKDSVVVKSPFLATTNYFQS
jgi:pimeloyl-ACP methyl ester carboxylesterase